jgi:hypothetical protein
MQLDATSMESIPITPELRNAAGHFNSNSVVQKSKTFQAEANSCFKNNKYKEAIELFAQAIQSNPVNALFDSPSSLVVNLSPTIFFPAGRPDQFLQPSSRAH